MTYDPYQKMSQLAIEEACRRLNKADTYPCWGPDFHRHDPELKALAATLMEAWPEKYGQPGAKDDCGGIGAIWDNIDYDAMALAILSDMDDRPFQARVGAWMQECFGPEISADRIKRGDRFLEEVFELLQAGGYDRTRILALIDYVWGRPIGEHAQEAGGTMVTLAAYCLAFGLNMHEAGEIELARIMQPHVMEKIRAKQAAKARDIPFSPLPQHTLLDKFDVENVRLSADRAGVDIPPEARTLTDQEG